MGLTERHWFENEDVPENYEWNLEDAVYNSYTNKKPEDSMLTGKVGEVKVNLIDYNQVVEALEKERQLLLNREQYGAEHVLVHHALNVIAELPIIRQPEIVRCKDCKHQNWVNTETGCIVCKFGRGTNAPDWFCADGEHKKGR